MNSRRSNAAERPLSSFSDPNLRRSNSFPLAIARARRALCAVACAGFTLQTPAAGDEPRSTEEALGSSEEAPRFAEEAPRAPTSNVLLGSLAYQAPTNFEKDFFGGGGIVYTREYFVSPRSALGIQAAARIFPAPPLHFAFGYGLSIKHYIGNLGRSKSSGLYLKYGLLLQMNFLEDRKGSGLGHDTLLAIGYDRTSGKVSPVIEVGYHLTALRGFDQEALSWPYIEVAAGIRF